MEKTVFKNQNFQISVIVGLSILMFWNLFALITTSNYLALIPLVLQSTLLILVSSKNKYAKLGIKVWSILLIVSPALLILSMTLKILVGDEIGPKIGPALIQVLILFAGLTIYHYNSTTVTVEAKAESKTEL